MKTFLNILKNSYLNCKALLYGRTDVQLFIRDVLKDPFDARVNNRLKTQFMILKSQKNNILLSQTDRVLLNVLFNNKKNYLTIINEMPHLFYKVLTTESRVYLTPESLLCNYRDSKMGDLFILKTMARFELKTFASLKEIRINKTISQYKNCNSKNNLSFCFFYKENKDNELFREEAARSLRSSLKLTISEISFISQKDLNIVLEPENFSKVLNYYNISEAEYYNDMRYVCKNLFNEVISTTQNNQIRERAKKKINELNFCKDDNDKFSKKILDLNLRRITKDIISNDMNNDSSDDIE